MKLSLIPLLACPDCRSDIELAQGETVIDDDVVNGILECTGCQRHFVIQRRFPLLLPNRFSVEQKKQMAIWDTQVEAYDANFPHVAFGLVEIPYLISALDLDPEYTLLDSGCGTGRMTLQLAAQVKELVCVDYSLKSLTEAERRVNEASVQNVHFLQGDVTCLPLKNSLFSRALSASVLDHIDSDELRTKAVSELSRTVLPGSTIVVSVNQYSMLSKDKSGEEADGTDFMRFTEEELTNLLQTSLDIGSISGLLIYLYVATCSQKL